MDILFLLLKKKTSILIIKSKMCIFYTIAK